MKVERNKTREGKGKKNGGYFTVKKAETQK
jgi:hypothetical protein